MKRWFAIFAAALLLGAFSLHSSVHSDDGDYSCAICSVQRSGHANAEAAPEPLSLTSSGEATKATKAVPSIAHAHRIRARAPPAV